MKNPFSEKALKIIKRIAIITACAVFALALIAIIMNVAVVLSANSKILPAPSAVTENDYDCILVLGAGIVRDRPSDILADRLDVAITLYKNGAAPKILVSGDHGNDDYDEVNVMKNYCMEKGVPSEDIFMDHAGFSTYESIYRAKEIFGIDKMIVCTQKYHLFRAIYISEAFDIETLGVNCTLREYRNQLWRECREVVARSKDFLASIFKPLPNYLGDKISLDGDGNVTNDKPL